MTLLILIAIMGPPLTVVWGLCQIANDTWRGPDHRGDGIPERPVVTPTGGVRYSEPTLSQ